LATGLTTSLFGFSMRLADFPLIKRLINELERRGLLCRTVRQSRRQADGRPPTEYWLTKGQAVFVCMHAETPNADEVRHRLADIFEAYDRGDLVPRSVGTAEPAAQARDDIGALLSSAMTPINERVTHIDAKVNGIDAKVDRLYERVDDIAPVRQYFSERTIAIWIEVLQKKYHSCCPIDQETRIIDDDGRRIEGVAEVDHRNGRHNIGLHDGWIVSKEAHDRLRDTKYANEVRQQFALFQYWVNKFDRQPSLGLELTATC
jgi:hypothetical protein